MWDLARVVAMHADGARVISEGEKEYSVEP